MYCFRLVLMFDNKIGFEVCFEKILDGEFIVRISIIGYVLFFDKNEL